MARAGSITGLFSSTQIPQSVSWSAGRGKRAATIGTDNKSAARVGFAARFERQVYIAV
jgi:hypothetical protein